MSPRRDRTVTVFVPVFDNETTLDELVRRVLATFEPTGRLVEVLLVDDASRDASWERIRALHDLDPRVRGLRLGRNVGTGTVRAVACTHARGELMCAIDGDLDYDPDELLLVLAALDVGNDFVSGVRPRQRDRRATRRAGSTLLRLLMGRALLCRPRDLACGLQGWDARLHERILPSLQTHRDVAWAITFLQQVERYAEVDISGYREQASASSFSTMRQAARLAEVAAAIWPRSGRAAVAGGAALTAAAVVPWRRHPLRAVGGAAAGLSLVGAGALLARFDPRRTDRGAAYEVVDRVG